ncbi:MAG: serine/threonine protein kinase, STE, PAK/STE20 [Geoglossum umbratile]|nr:MAG: serine/threonine protein kinase, STE, PAK/STE20 [Geoglossum umbratile]
MDVTRNYRPQAPCLPSASPSSSLGESYAKSPALAIRGSSPWDRYERLCDLYQGQMLSFCCGPDGAFAAVREINEEQSMGWLLLDIRRMQHKHIIIVKDILQHEGKFFVATEYFRHTLAEISSVYMTLSENQIRTVAVSLSAAIEYMCDLGIVHGEITSETIRVSREGRIVLTNFESCTSVPDGSPMPTTDVESLGLALLELMNGALPYTPDSSREDLVKAIRLSRSCKILELERWSPDLVDYLQSLFAFPVTPRSRVKTKPVSA